MVEIDKSQIYNRVEVLGKWLWLLFWLFVPSTIAGLIASESVAEFSFGLYWIGQVLSIVCVIVYGAILLKLSTENELYRVAGICNIIVGVVNAMVFIFSGGSEAAMNSLIITLPLAIASLIGEYNEYMGHADEVRIINPVMADKWQSLWKWYIGILIVTVISPFIIVIFSVIGVILLLAAALGSIIVSIMKLVYLYQTAKLFRNYGDYKPVEEESLDEYRFNL